MEYERAMGQRNQRVKTVLRKMLTVLTSKPSEPRAFFLQISPALVPHYIPIMVILFLEMYDVQKRMQKKKNLKKKMYLLFLN